MLKKFPICALWLILLPALPGLAWARGNPAALPDELSAAVYQTTVDYDVPIVLRDGTTVYADIFRPDAEGTFPVLIEGTPYGKQSATDILLGTHEFFPPRGYVFMVWDVRGRGLSEGRFDNMHLAEQEDGYDVVEWAARQSWSNGKVGLVGNSYGGQVALHTAAGQPPHLVCAAPMLTAKDLWREWYYRGGAMEYGFASYWATVVFSERFAREELSPEAYERWQDMLAMYMADPDAYASVVPIIDFAPTRISPQTNLLKEWALHPTEDEYWIEKSPGAYFNRIQIPMLHIGGWYDIFLAGTIKSWLALQDEAETEFARENQRLLIGPWAHSGHLFSQSKHGAIDYGPGLVNPSFNATRLAFFDYWLKDVQTEIFNPDLPVRIFVMGENVWRDEPTWPLERAQYVKYYLHGGPSASIASLNDGRLSTSPPGPGSMPDSYDYDPFNPLPMLAGPHLFSFAYGRDGTTLQGGYNQLPVELKSLTYTTDVLAEDLEITGPVKAVLYAASSAVDTDWIVRLSSVGPDGVSINFAEGILRARFRESNSEPSLIEPGQIYEYNIDLWATSYVVPRGNRIRVTVNSSSYPHWSRNMNVAEFPEQATSFQVARQSVYHEADYPSHILLPLIQD